MATFALFDEVINYIFVPSTAALTGEPLDFDTDVFRVALSNTTLNATSQASHDFLNDVTQITSGNGYTTVTNAAGATADNPTFAETGAGSGVWQFTTSSIIFTAGASAMAQFRYPVLVNSDVTDGSNNPVLIGFLDYGSAVDLQSGSTFTVNVGTNGWFQITVPNFA